MPTFAYPAGSLAPGAFPTHTTAIITNCEDSGPGSLRDAVANAASGDSIDLSHLSCSVISLITGAVVIGQSDLSLIGPGRRSLSIDAANNGQQAALYHLGGGLLYVSGMAIENGNKYRSTADSLGGCIHSGGSLELVDLDVRNCSSTSIGSYSSLGGAIFASGRISLTNSTVSGNIALASGDGYASGGAIYGLDGLLATYSTISDSTALSKSATPSFGGGVFMRGYLYLGHSTVSGNVAARMGGIADFTDFRSTLVMRNSTVSGNSAYWIGGVYANSARIEGSTISFNTSTSSSDGAGNTFAAGLQFQGNEVIDIESSILSNNIAELAEFDLGGPSGFIVVNDHSIVMASDVPFDSAPITEDPLLEPLQNNGGPTRTHKPAPGSIAIGNGHNNVFGTYDQRGPGFPRDIGPTDIGAYELNPDTIFINGFD